MLEKIKCPKKSYYRCDGVTADEYFEPKLVWEIKCADLSISPVHSAAAGMVDPTKGISLRFPRFIRERDDKNPDQATNAEQIVEMYNAQGAFKIYFIKLFCASRLDSKSQFILNMIRHYRK